MEGSKKTQEGRERCVVYNHSFGNDSRTTCVVQLREQGFPPAAIPGCLGKAIYGVTSRTDARSQS